MKKRNKAGKRTKSPLKTHQQKQIKTFTVGAEIIVRRTSASATTMTKRERVVLNKREKLLFIKRSITTKENSMRTTNIKRKMEQGEAVVVVDVEAVAVVMVIDLAHTVISNTKAATVSMLMERTLETSVKDVKEEADARAKMDRTFKKAEEAEVAIISKTVRLMDRLVMKKEHSI